LLRNQLAMLRIAMQARLIIMEEEIKKQNSGFVKILFDLFYLSIVLYISTIIMENLKPGLISNYFDINKLLFIIIPLGVMCILINNKTNN
jgi:hypothetical protein